jgi:hypothetical protein
MKLLPTLVMPSKWLIVSSVTALWGMARENNECK